MNNTAARIFAALAAAYPTVTATAAALGVSKQTYSIARQRLSLSDDLCIRACTALGLDASITLVSLHMDDATTPETIAVWKDIFNRITRQPQTTDNGTPDDQADRRENANGTEHNIAGNTNYAAFRSVKKSGLGFCVHDIDNYSGPDIFSGLDTMDSNTNGTHQLPLSDRIKSATRLVKWMLCVPKFSPDSPRFKYYADNWHVLDKIQRFVASGEFDTMTKDCPAFSAKELRAALDYLDDSDTAKKPQNTTVSKAPRQAFALA